MFEFIKIDYGYGFEVYKIYNFEDMTDKQIIDRCDPNNFGGRITKYDGYAIAKIYID